jgi:IS30 family transposase
MSNYKQLGQEQRYLIDRLLWQGKTQKEIADVF